MQVRRHGCGAWFPTLRAVRSTVLATALVGLSGCGSGNRTFNPMVPERTSSASLPTQIDKFNDQASAAQALYDIAVDDRGRTRARDQVIANRILAYDVVFEDFAWNAWGADATTATVADWAVLGLTAAGSLATGGASQALSATATAVTGAKTSLQKNYLYTKTLDQLIYAMTVNRARIRSHILSCMERPDSGYSLSAAMIDIEQYKQAGMLPLAVANLSVSPENKTVLPCSSSVQISDMPVVPTSTTDLVTAWLRPNGVSDPDRQKKLQTWMQTAPNAALHNAPVEELRSAPQYEADRQQAIDALIKKQ